MAINRDFIEPAVAVTIARRALAEFDINDSTSLASYFPSQEVDDIEYEIEVGADAGFITAANWRAFNGATTSERWGEGRKDRGRFMPLSRNYTLDEEGALRMRNNANSLIEREAGKLIARGAKAIALAVNRQRANALQYGFVNIHGSGGLRQKIDFGRKPEFNTTAPVLFDDPAAGVEDILGYLESLADLYEDENGFRPEEMWVPKRIQTMIGTNPEMAKVAARSEVATRASKMELNELFSQYDLPEIKTTPKSLIQVDNLETGAEERIQLFDQDAVLFTAGSGDPTAPDSSIYGRTFWGRTQSADLPEFREIGADGLPGVVAAVYTGGWPYKQEVIVDALTMPVAFNANYTLRSKVVEADPKEPKTDAPEVTP